MPRFPRVLRFERLTRRARKAILEASDQAGRLGHKRIGPEHILLVLLEDKGGLAYLALQALGVRPHELRANVEAMHGPAQGASGALRRGEGPLTAQSKEVLILALDEARRLGHHYIGSEHLLLGLMLQEESIAGRALVSSNLTVDQLREKIVQLLSEHEDLAQREKLTAEVGPRGNVVACRIDDGDLAHIDALVEVGVRTTRSEAAAWLIHEGIEANRGLFEQVSSTVDEIRRLRDQAKTIAQQISDTGEGGGPASLSSP